MTQQLVLYHRPQPVADPEAPLFEGRVDTTVKIVHELLVTWNCECGGTFEVEARAPGVNMEDPDRECLNGHQCDKCGRRATLRGQYFPRREFRYQPVVPSRSMTIMIPDEGLSQPTSNTSPPSGTISLGTGQSAGSGGRFEYGASPQGPWGRIPASPPSPPANPDEEKSR